MGFFSGGIGFNLVTLLVAVVGISVTGIGVYYARKAVFPPKRRLTYFVLPPVSLLSGDSGSTKDIEVRYQGEDLKDPYLVTISVENTGSHAVMSSQFDKSRPAVIDLGVPIKAVPKIVVTPGAGAGFEHSVSGAELRLGPDLLNPGQSVVVQLLTEGLPDVGGLEERTVHHLGETKIEFKDRQPTVREQVRSSKVWTLVGALIGVASLVASLVALYNAAGISVSLSPDNGPPGTRVVLSGKGAERFAVISVYTNDGETSTTTSNVTRTVGTSTATEKVTIYDDTLELGQGQADQDGRFQVSFTVPEGIAKGAMELIVTVRQSGSTSFGYEDFFIR
ncbi:hypothetical protein [Lentzea sp. NPDC051838]|uniref:hypothetical protein n=1 Tax=Lentzea sp. NPDC051838 TaxID=3154849 RepID=UPI0034427C00